MQVKSGSSLLIRGGAKVTEPWEAGGCVPGGGQELRLQLHPGGEGPGSWTVSRGPETAFSLSPGSGGQGVGEMSRTAGEVGTSGEADSVADIAKNCHSSATVQKQTDF